MSVVAATFRVAGFIANRGNARIQRDYNAGAERMRDLRNDGYIKAKFFEPAIGHSILITREGVMFDRGYDLRRTGNELAVADLANGPAFLLQGKTDEGNVTILVHQDTWYNFAVTEQGLCRTSSNKAYKPQELIAFLDRHTDGPLFRELEAQGYVPQILPPGHNRCVTISNKGAVEIERPYLPDMQGNPIARTYVAHSDREVFYGPLEGGNVAQIFLRQNEDGTQNGRVIYNGIAHLFSLNPAAIGDELQDYKQMPLPQFHAAVLGLASNPETASAPQSTQLTY